MARKQRPPEDTGTWMNTYSDLVTLLLTFFVLLFSFSSVNAEKWEQFVKAFQNPGDETAQVVFDSDGEGTHLASPSGEAPMSADSNLLETTDLENTLPEDFDELYLYLKAYAEQNNMTESVETTKGENAVYIRFQNNIFFDPDKAYLREEAYEVLDFFGSCLKNVEDEVMMININGHTASVPNPDTYRVSDWTLSSERASNIAIYFEEEKGIDPHKLRPIGYGRNYPIASNDTPEGREKNRRVDMVIISEEADIAKDGELSQELAGLFDPSLFPKSGSTADILIPGEDETEEEASSPAQSEAQTQTDTAENTTADMAEPTAPEEQQ